MGGGIYVEDVQTSVTMDNSYNITMEGNTALYGGAFASAVDGALLMNNVIMRNNHAHQGSAGYVVGTLILTRGYFSNNQATMMNGGVVYYYSANHAQNCSTCVVLPDNVDDTSGTPTPSAITSAPSQLSVSSSNLDFAAGGAGTPSNPLVSADLVSGTTIELDLTVRDALGNLIQSVSTNYKVVATLSPILNGALVGYSAVTLNAGAASVSITFVGYLNSPFTLAIQVVDLSGALLASVAPLTIAFSTSSNCGEDKTQQLTTVSNGLTYPICVPAELSTVSTSAFIAVQVVTSLCAVGTIVIFVILRRHLSHSSIRASSPVLLQFMLASTVLVYAAIFLMGVDSGSDDNSLVSLSTVASNICRAIPWLLGLGFDLVYGAMLAKAWRIHKIFNNRLRRRIMLTDGNLIKHIVIFAMHDIILNAVWVGVDPLGLEYHVLSSSSSGTTVTSQCRSDNFGIYLAIYLAFKGAVLLAGIYLAIACRNVADQFNESKQLGFAIYNLTFISCIIIPLVLAIQASATVVYLIAAFGTLLALVMTIAIIFVPKIVLVYSGADTSVQNTSSKSNATIPRVNVSDASETQWAEINAHLSKLNAATLKRSAADFNDAFDSLAIILEHLSTAYEGSESRSHKSQGGPTSEHEMKSKVSNKASAEAVVVAV
ncbi:hypothetical protein CAOG_008244 [Capsaspora owczarzaki ATCC 30864]|uniref:G-protein coupled receptors family 3 profile domain-containing protein n=2 Tax=Capsaspora owczarzaki (strain ATCC 30864) TaxID=595528 RepID=A0A0D2WYU6_CAPO3|nr:hypothetical protein CAOG_008244 [Capsaspora owczarzaki ATCC 30864]